MILVGRDLSQNFTGGDDAESLVRSLVSLAAHQMVVFPVSGPGPGEQRYALVLR